MTPPLVGRLAGPLERMTPLRRWVLILLLLLVAAFALRARHFGNPVIHIDEQFYLLVGENMLHGRLPLVDFWDRKPPGLFLIFAAIRLLGGNGIVEYQVVATLFAAATAFLLALMAARFAPLFAAILAGFCYLLYLGLFGGEGGQTPVFYNLLVALSATLTLAAISRERFDGRAFVFASLAMLVAGLAIQVKYTVVFEGAFFGLALLWRARATGASWPALAACALFWALLGIAPTVAAYAFYASIGYGGDFIFANFLSTSARAVQEGKVAERLVKMFGMSAPLWVCAILGRIGRDPAAIPDLRAHDFALGWAAAVVGGVVLFGTYFEHYTLPMLVPLSVAAAPALADWRSGVGIVSRGRAWRLPFLIFVPLFGLVAQELVLAKNIRNRGGATAFYAMADWIRPRLRPGQCIYVHDGDPLLYRETGSCFPTRWSFPAHLDNLVEAEALGVDPVAELRRIMAARPRFVIISEQAPGNAYGPSRAFMLGELRRNWRLVHAVQAGKNRRLVYEPSGVPTVPRR